MLPAMLVFPSVDLVSAYRGPAIEPQKRLKTVTEATGIPILVLHDVTKTYAVGSGRVVALDHVNLAIRPGEYVGIMGPSGSGKTTLLNVMDGMDRPTAGEVWFDGQRLDRLTEQKLLQIRRNGIGHLFQEPRLMASLTALENVMLPTAFGGRVARKNARARAMELLQKVGLEHRVHHLADQLSGGEAQRVCIARTLMAHPRLILADEPTGNLDHKTRLGIVEVFARLNGEGYTVILVTHDPEIADQAPRRLVISDGRIAGDTVSRPRGEDVAQERV